ncbi:MmcQ/YjbR family DNA-binding protein [Zunongwangia sp. HRR-M8]|uniref:MmcQ/YjbR family DNA-binding protein n=1 Tax=Zunongwangia sp. HRR-M8 TaxID=3015170 RepID=UPI0022DD64F2|nr:MmcQ/YjbR family DNA-binding protein [Zunongwangia sp. HRR-M8]WBL22814.1 MmcQ/YjbR family DNA-binding protein [Zunongwangia sp. HRR-M8]
MDIDTFRDYCLNKKAVTEHMPFGPETLVFKVMGKMFALVSLDAVPLRINLKCNPDKSLELREEFDGKIIPGYHMNKQHWNTMILDGQIPAKLIFELTDHSYQLIVDGLNKNQKQEFDEL